MAFIAPHGYILKSAAGGLMTFSADAARVFLRLAMKMMLVTSTSTRRHVACFQL